jgi:hypothetical protein
MNWKKNLKGKQVPRHRAFYVSVDMSGYEHLYHWLNLKAAEHGTTKADLLRAILQDAYDEEPLTGALTPSADPIAQAPGGSAPARKPATHTRSLAEQPPGALPTSACQEKLGNHT